MAPLTEQLWERRGETFARQDLSFAPDTGAVGLASERLGWLSGAGLLNPSEVVRRVLRRAVWETAWLPSVSAVQECPGVNGLMHALQ